MADNPKVSISIPFSTSSHAQIASEVLNVDKELKGVKRNISVEGTNLVVTFEGADYKYLRVILNGLLKNLILITKTMSMFNCELI